MADRESQTSGGRVRLLGDSDVAVELGRIRQRSRARLGPGIRPWMVRKMVAKLDTEKDQQ